jgi:hypothetical protein
MLAPTDEALLRAFLMREAEDFLGRSETAFVNVRMDRIAEALDDLAGAEIKINYLKFVSLSNLGLVMRRLDLTPANSHWAPTGEVEVVLCMCGSDDCWGSVRYEP